MIEGLIDVIERADDSEGELHAVGGRVIALHADLCAKTSVDPLALAETLFEREMSAVTDLFSGALQDYRVALGLPGRTEFLRLAQHAWTALPSRKRGGDDHRRAPLKWILDAAFAEDGDLEARVALRQGDLTTPDAYREIAGLYDAADRLDEAVRWIEDGLWAFEGLANDQLEGLGAELMMKVGRTDEAEHLYWALFERRPSLRQFLLVAQVCPTTAAPRALEFLKTAAKGEPRRDRFSVGPEAALMEIQIHLGDFSSAWETAETWPVGDYAIRRLADQSAATHPQPATAAYSRLAEARISAATASGYDEAITLIRSRGETCGDLADQAAFIKVCDSVTRPNVRSFSA